MSNQQTKYYYELDLGCGETHDISDSKVIDKLCNTFGKSLMVIYKESDTPDGTPFIIVYERIGPAKKITKTISH